MSRSTLGLDAPVRDYLIAHGTREHPMLARLREATAAMPNAMMQISVEQGAFLQLLMQILGAKKTLEVGTFTGYSALAVALALPEDGQVVACDVNEEWTAMGREHWDAAGVGHKVDLRIAPAVETLDALIADGQEGSFDFAFIDADKGGYVAYYERSLKLLRPGGVIGIDNVLWSGRVVDEADQEDSTNAIRRVNALVADDPRVDVSMLPIGDGLTLARKR